MDIRNISIDKDIKAGVFPRVYLLCGEETYLVRQYRNKLQKALTLPGDTMNVSFFTGEQADPRKIISLADTMPFFAERRCLFIDDSGLFQKSCDELAEYIEQIPDTACLIFTESGVDKRGKLYKRVKKYGSIVEFTRLSKKDLQLWMKERFRQNKKTLTLPVCDLLLDKCGNDMEILSREMEKVFSYTLEKDNITEEDVEAVCSTQTADRIFDMIDELAAGKQREALEIYYDLLLRREAPMRILILSTRHFNRLLQVKELYEKGVNDREAAYQVGIYENYLWKYQKQARKFSYERLLQALEDGVAAEEEIKTGQMNDRLAAELYLVRCSSV